MRKLPQLHELEHVTELLNLPGIQQADLGEDATAKEQTAVLLAQIAAWAADAAQNAKYGLPNYLQQPRRYAYLIETIQEHGRHWWDVGRENGYGIEESADGPEAFAVTALLRFLGRVRAHRDDYEYLFDDDVHIRASVWDVDSVAASWPAMSTPEDLPDPVRFAFQAMANRIGPHAIELRTSIQVHRYILG